MNLKDLQQFFLQSQQDTESKVPAGYCPNCWGRQEYDQRIRKLYKDHQIDVNNHQAHYAFIKDFVVRHIDGIHLKKGDNGLVCPTCHLKYTSQ